MTAPQITATRAAEILGVADGPTARRTLRRWGINPVGRAPGRGGESLFDERAVRAAQEQRAGRGTRMDLLRDRLRPLAQTIVDDAPLPRAIRVDRHDLDGSLDGIVVLVSWHRMETFPSLQMHAEERERVDSVWAISPTRLVADDDTEPDRVHADGERRWVYGEDLRDVDTLLAALVRVVAAARRDLADDQAAAMAARLARQAAVAELTEAADRVDAAMAAPDRPDLMAAFEERRHRVRTHRDAEGIRHTHRLTVTELAAAARMTIDEVKQA